MIPQVAYYKPSFTTYELKTNKLRNLCNFLQNFSPKSFAYNQYTINVVFKIYCVEVAVQFHKEWNILRRISVSFKSLGSILHDINCMLLQQCVNSIQQFLFCWCNHMHTGTILKYRYYWAYISSIYFLRNMMCSNLQF